MRSVAYIHCIYVCVRVCVCVRRVANAALRLLACSVDMVDKEISTGRRGHVKADRCPAADYGSCVFGIVFIFV